MSCTNTWIVRVWVVMGYEECNGYMYMYYRPYSTHGDTVSRCRAGMQGMCPINVSVCFRVLSAVWLSSPRDPIVVNVTDPTRYLLSDNTATQTDNTPLSVPGTGIRSLCSLQTYRKHRQTLVLIVRLLWDFRPEAIKSLGLIHTVQTEHRAISICVWSKESAELLLVKGCFTRTVSPSPSSCYHCVNGNGQSSCRMGSVPICKKTVRLHSHNDKQRDRDGTVRVNEPYGHLAQNSRKGWIGLFYIEMVALEAVEFQISQSPSLNPFWAAESSESHIHSPKRLNVLRKN